MHPFKRLALLALLISACTPITTPSPQAALTGPAQLLPEDNPYAPQSNDAAYQKAGYVISSINLAQETDSGRTIVMFNGSLPTPCHELRVEIKPPNNNYEVHMKLYSVLRPGLTCENVLRQFDARVLLGVYTPGVYSLWVNKQRIADFVSY